MLVEVDPLPKVRARAGGLRWLGANESLQPACDTCGQIPKLAHARGVAWSLRTAVACPLCHVGCTLECVPGVGTRARCCLLNTPTRALSCDKSGVSIARSVRSVHRRRGASVTVSRAPRTARARPARLRHSCCLLRARQPSGRSRSTPTLLTASTERPHPLLPSGKHRAWCRRLASEYAVPVRQISQYRKAWAISQYPLMQIRSCM